MQSMTGYGKSQFVGEGVTLTVEVKTVNNRFLDVIVKAPRIFARYEDLLRKTVSAYLTRGRVELMVNLKLSEQAAKPVSVDKTILQSYYQSFLEVKKDYPDLAGDVSVYNLMRFPGVIVEADEADAEIYKKPLFDCLEDALSALNRMRKEEGDKLKADLTARIATVKELVGLISQRAPLIKDEYKEKLKARIEEYLGGVNMDQTRLLQEVAIFADKSNIDEELTRLNSHISQFLQIVKTDSCGKRLDFLLQEFNREANTICSKSNDLTITDNALKLKCEIEKIREQIQNVE